MHCSSDDDYSRPDSLGSSTAEKECRYNFLPEEIWENTVMYLHARDILSLLSVNRRLHNGMGKSTNFWEMLSGRDGASCYQRNDCESRGQQSKRSCNHECDWRDAKDSFLFRCHKADPTTNGGGIQWYPVRPYGRFPGISEREGHISCVLSRHKMSSMIFDDPLVSSEGGRRGAKSKERIVVITGGFCEDDSVCMCLRDY
mmetsp:Transcript_14191/g.39671  ORF Transcript_14191/g.39671 Transcript_14191/m.39671 type:complete len:200 (-) Transcript_14191:40-639(-)